MNIIYQRNFKKYVGKAKLLLKDNDRVKDLLTNAVHKLKGVIENNENLKEFSEKILVLFRMFKAQFTGDYRELPWKTLVMIAGAMIYFVTPIDMIPDFIPALGLTDDAAVVYYIYNSIKEDVARFKEWEQTIEIEEVHAS